MDNFDNLEVLDGIYSRSGGYSIANVELQFSNFVRTFDDVEFKRHFRVTKDTFEEIVANIPSDRHPRGRHYSTKCDILCLLSYLSTGSFMFLTSKVMDLSITTCHRCIHRAMNLVCQQFDKFVKFPNNLSAVKEKFQYKYGIPGIIGAIDGTHIPIQKIGGDLSERFRCRKGYFSINVQAVCGLDNMFYDAVIRWSGSTHDSRIFESSSLYARLETKMINGMVLGDSGYPLKTFCLTPYRSTNNSRQESRFSLFFFTFKDSINANLKQGLLLKEPLAF